MFYIISDVDIGFRCMTLPISRLFIQSSNFLMPNIFLPKNLNLSFFLNYSISSFPSNFLTIFELIFLEVEKFLNSFLKNNLNSSSSIILLLLSMKYWSKPYKFLCRDFSILNESSIKLSLILDYSSTYIYLIVLLLVLFLLPKNSSISCFESS